MIYREFSITITFGWPRKLRKTPMDMVAQVMEKVNTVFDKNYLMELAHKTGFIKRKRKIDPKNFLEKNIMLRLECPQSHLGDLVYEFHKSDVIISKQALHKKFNTNAVSFVQGVLDKLLEHVFGDQHACIGAVPYIKSVKVIDSSEIRLNPRLKSVFPQVRNQGAAVKLQALMNVINNQILSLNIRSSNEPDQGYKKHIGYIQEGDLLIGDLGYFCVNSFHEVKAKNGYFLSRYFKNTNLYDLTTRERIDLRATLSQAKEEQVEFNLALGTSRLACRVVAMKLPEDAYQQRLKNFEKKRRKDPRTKENADDILNQWTILVTNLPLSAGADILLQLYRLRWQIELLFKMMKTFMNLRTVEDTNQYRASISLGISLIAMTLLCLVAMTITEVEISLYKAGRTFVIGIRDFFYLINNKKKCAISWLRQTLCEFAQKESRRKRPSTKHLLGGNYA